MPPSPRVCIVGPLLGSNQGWVISQGEVLAARLVADGYQVRTTSSIPGRWRRLFDVCWSLVRWRNHYDIAIVMVFSGSAFWVSRIAGGLCRRLRKKLVLWLHGGDLPSFLASRRSAAAWLSRAGDAVVAPSSYLLQTVSPPPHRAHTIPNVVPDEGLGFRQRSEVTPRILWMRTFHSIYRPFLALHTLEVLLQQGIDARLTLAGQDRGMTAAVVAAAAERGLDERVAVVGFLSPAQKQRALLEHDVFLNTTAVDNFPVSLIEAARAGLPVVTTAVGGIPALFTDGVDALLVDRAEGAPLAGAIRRLVEDPELVRRISLGGRELAERCTWGGVGALWRSLLENL